MVPPQMAFLRRWPWRIRSKGPALSVGDELLVMRELRRLRDFDVGVESIVADPDDVIVDEA